jgi:NitT/TauT family transport system substrate-binding protein
MGMKWRKRLAILGAVVLLVSVVSACGNKNKETAANPSAAAESPITLRVGYNLWVGSAGLYIAEKKGYFKELGVDVKLVEFPNPTETTQALLAGHVDIAGTTLDTAVMVKSTEPSGKNLKFFHLIDESFGADGIVAKSNIATIADLKGKTVAVTIGAVNHFLLSHALQSAGINEADVNLTNAEPEQTGPLFLTGKVDAAVTWEPYLSEAKSKGGKILYSTKDAPDLIIDGDMTSEKLIQEHPEALRKFSEAIEKGRQFYMDNPEEGAQIVADKIQASKEDVKSMMEGVKLMSTSDSKVTMIDKKSDTEKLASEFSAFFKSRDLIKKDVAGSDILDDFLYR